ncbi:MAG: tetratricopeptide repeat protein [Bdellovibrionales bacterium]|nr:tetratricopeptide repeat protein [Oligoflexia bacterium]
MKYWKWCALSLLLGLSSQAATSNLYVQAKRLLDNQDFLGLRIYIKNAYSQKMTQGEWYSLKNIISGSADRLGYDLIPFWNARNNRGRAEVDGELFQVDQLMKDGNYDQAFTLAQNAAVKMKALQKTRWDAGIQLPYIYHSMGRALYGSRRYEEALKVYQWINPKYPFFVQVLFEKMWAAFKAGRVDMALGAIASQRSAYFSKYLAPESYLVQTYLYRKLCRDDDQKQVVNEMKEYEALLSKPDAVLPPISDVNTLVLTQLANQPLRDSDNIKLYSVNVREHEQTEIKNALKKQSEMRRTKTLNDLKTVIAYQQLSGQADSKTVLKPVESMKSRDDLLKQNLEVWPADSAEEWMDELGKHVLIGESLCKQQK